MDARDLDADLRRARRILDRACRPRGGKTEYALYVLGWLMDADPHLGRIYEERLNLAHPPKPLDGEALRLLAYFDLKAAYQEQGLPHPAFVAPEAVQAIRHAPLSCFTPLPRQMPRASRGRPIRRRSSRRTCAPTRGDPDDGDPEPPGVRTPADPEADSGDGAMRAARTCEVCGASLEGRRPQARYCSSSCRTAAWKGRTGYRDDGGQKPSRNASEHLPDGRWRTAIGRCLTITVPADWPERSAEFWAGLTRVMNRRRGITPRGRR